MQGRDESERQVRSPPRALTSLRAGSLEASTFAEAAALLPPFFHFTQPSIFAMTAVTGLLIVPHSSWKPAPIYWSHPSCLDLISKRRKYPCARLTSRSIKHATTRPARCVLPLRLFYSKNLFSIRRPSFSMMDSFVKSRKISHKPVSSPLLVLLT